MGVYVFDRSKCILTRVEKGTTNTIVHLNQDQTNNLTNLKFAIEAMVTSSPRSVENYVDAWQEVLEMYFKQSTMI